MISSQPVNPIRVYTVDYEMTFKFFKYFLERNKMLPPEQLAQATGPLVAHQMGIHTGKDRVKHIHLNDIVSQIPSMGNMFYDKGREAHVGTIKMQSMSDLDEFFEHNNPNFRGADLDRYKRKLGYKFVQDAETVVNRGTFATSIWSDDKFFKEPMDAVNSAIKASGGINFVEKDFNTFIHGKGEDSLFKIVSDLLEGATPNKPAVMQAWNASIEANVTASMLSAGGHTDLLNDLMSKFYSGAFKVSGMEEEWQKVAYRLSQENQEAFKNLTIHWTPEAAKATANPGGKVKSFSDFKYSTMPWNQELVGKLFSLDDQIHYAGPDVKQAIDINRILKGVQNKAVKLAQEAGHNIDSFEGLFSVASEDDFVSQALDTILKARTAKFGGKFGSTRQVVEKLGGTVDNMFKFNTDYRNLFFGKDIPGGKFKASRYAGMAATAIILAGATYLGTKRDTVETTGFDNKIVPGSNFPSISMINRSDEDIRDEPNIPKDIIGGLVMPLLASASVVAGVGYGAYKRTPPGFGYKPPQIKSAFDAIKTAASTFRHGIKSIEATVPLFRVFQISNLADVMFGSHKYMVDPVSKLGRYYSFDVIKNNRVVGRSGEALGNFDQLLKAAVESNPEHAEWLKNLRPTEAGSTDRRIIKIAKTTDGKAFLYYEDLSSVEMHPTGVKSLVGDPERGRFFDLDIEIANIRNTNTRNRSSAFRHFEENFKEKILNPFGYERSLRSLIHSDEFGKVRRQDYKSFQRPPGVAAKFPLLNSIYNLAEDARYFLDLYPKGIGEGKNYRYYDITNAALKKTDAVFVKGYSKGRRTEGLKYSASYANDIINQYILHPIDTFLEAPFELLFANANKIDARAESLIRSKSLTKNIAGKALAFLNRPHLGLGYNRMKYGLPQYIAEFGIKRVLPFYVGMNMFDFGDKVLGKLAGTSDVGLVRGGAVWGAQKAMLAYSKLSDMTGLTSWAKWQNDVAPGSTGAGVFAGSMSALTAYKLGEFMYKKGPVHFRNYVDTAFDKTSTSGSAVQKWVRQNIANNKWVKGALEKEIRPLPGAGASGMQKLFNWAIKNPKKGIFAAALIPSIPFLPGFFGSDKSYAERKAEFKGQKEVPIRKFRGWLLSSSPFSGDKPNQFRRHALNLMSEDWESKAIWPSWTDKILHKATFGLYKPNILEEYHKEAQPVYRTSSAAENIPLIGPFLAGVSNMIWPSKKYHEVAEATIGGAGGYPTLSGVLNPTTGEIDPQAAGFASQGVHYSGGKIALMSKFIEQTSELAGFKGFTLQTLAGKTTGYESPDQYMPKLETSAKMYNPAYGLWGYQAGDITGIAGEFLRRIYQNPSKEGWTINEIPNELAQAEWIPKDDEYKDFTKGTTFDKMPMGWLYAARKGWEWLYPEVQGQDLNNYSDPVKLEILQQIAPYSTNFTVTSNNVMGMAVNGQLTPAQEQSFYDTLDQVRQVRQQIWAHASEETYSVETEEITGIVSYIDLNTGKFGIEGSDRQFRVAGVSVAEADIRRRLLNAQEYTDTNKLMADTQMIKERTAAILAKRLAPGSEIEFDVASASNLGGKEAIIGGLQEQLWDAGASFADTGALSTFNLNQDRKGFGSKGLAKYWDAMVDENTFFTKKLISDRDYLGKYLGDQVFSKQVRLWTKPIDHLLKPMIAQTLHRLGVDFIPSFTEERRANQQYWDVVRYVKYKTLEEKAIKEGNQESAKEYYNLWRQTLTGADPTDSFRRDELLAIPKNERAYFNFFANEPDPEKRAKIMKYIPETSKRIFYSLWAKKIAEASDDPEMHQLFSKLQEGEGYLLTEDEEELYEEQTDGKVSKGDWARAQLVSNFVKENPLPGSDWEGWAPNVSLDNVEVLSLRDEGEQIQDYGFFETQMRQAIYDDTAFKAALVINSINRTPSSFTGEMIPALMHVQSMRMLPTDSANSTSELTIQTNDYNKRVAKQNDAYVAMLDDKYIQE